MPPVGLTGKLDKVLQEYFKLTTKRESAEPGAETIDNLTRLLPKPNSAEQGTLQKLLYDYNTVEVTDVNALADIRKARHVFVSDPTSPIDHKSILSTDHNTSKMAP